MAATAPLLSPTDALRLRVSVGVLEGEGVPVLEGVLDGVDVPVGESVPVELGLKVKLIPQLLSPQLSAGGHVPPTIAERGVPPGLRQAEAKVAVLPLLLCMEYVSGLVRLSPPVMSLLGKIGAGWMGRGPKRAVTSAAGRPIICKNDFQSVFPIRREVIEASQEEKEGGGGG